MTPPPTSQICGMPPGPYGELPLCWLLAKWLPGKEEPPTDCPTFPPIPRFERLVGPAKLRWRREL